MFENRQAADAWIEPCSSCLFCAIVVLIKYYLINGNLLNFILYSLSLLFHRAMLKVERIKKHLMEQPFGAFLVHPPNNDPKVYSVNIADG